ncbi:hypothetical protein AB0D12_35685 [Streptomyces sp. NPDC048479]|uniref:hypothetical protein n=1 Tax=Streptomyces sp. NPDC048479 TaxID=3154725 RepID=UPI00342F9594
MILVLGLIILIAAVTIGVVGVFTNDGSAHGLTGGFSVFGYNVTGSTGTLFLYGIIIGAAVLLGLGLLLIGARRSASRRSSLARRKVARPRHEPAVLDRERDDQIERRDTARATETATVQENDRPAATGESRRGGRHWFGHRSAPR